MSRTRTTLLAGALSVVAAGAVVHSQDGRFQIEEAAYRRPPSRDSGRTHVTCRGIVQAYLRSGEGLQRRQQLIS